LHVIVAMHIKPLLESDGLPGEQRIDDLILFRSSGRLAAVHRMWCAITKYALMMDKTHAEALNSVRDFLAQAPPPITEGALDDLVMAEMEHQILSDSDSYIVKSILFLMLISFSEFALKQVYKLYQPPEPPPPARKAVKRIIATLKRRKAITQVPASYEANFSNHIDPVRNGFAHGDWMEIGQALNNLDLTKSFLSVAEYFLVIQQNLRDQGHDV